MAAVGVSGDDAGDGGRCRATAAAAAAAASAVALLDAHPVDSLEVSEALPQVFVL